MAFANIGSTAGQFDQNTSTDTVSASVPSLGANRIGIVMVNRHHNSTRTISGITWNGVSMTQAVVENTNANTRAAIFYLANCAHNGTYNIVVTYSSLPVTHVSLVTVAWADASGTISLDDTSSAQGTAQNPTITSTQAGANELVVSGSVSQYGALGAPSVTDCTLLNDRDGPVRCMVSAYSTPASSGDVTHQHNYGSSAIYAIASASFQEAIGGGASAIPVIMNQYRQRRA